MMCNGKREMPQPYQTLYQDRVEEGKTFGILAQFCSFGGHFGANFGFISGHLLVLLPVFVTLAHFYSFLALPNIFGTFKASKKPQNGHKTG